MADSDAPLLARAQAGELAAFEELVGRHERHIFTLARRITGHEQDAEDVTQQTFLDALEHLADFRADASFRTWVSRIATYAALKVLRRRRTRPTVSLDAATEPVADDSYANIPHPEYITDWRATPDELAHHNETRALIDAALTGLDEKHRLVFLLRDVEGLSVRESAAALGITETNVKVRLLRARLQLREQLTRAFGESARRLPPHRHETE